MEHSTQVVVQATPDAVWEVMADVERWPTWTSSVTGARPLQSGPLAVGSRIRLKQPGFPAAVWEVTEVEVGRGFTWVSRSPGLTSTARHEVTRIGDGSRVVLSIRQEGPLSFVAAVFAGRTRDYVQREADGLKRRCESGRDQLDLR